MNQNIKYFETDGVIFFSVNKKTYIYHCSRPCSKTKPKIPTGKFQP